MVAAPIYMDNNATTRVDPRVLEEMLPFFGEHYGNAASLQHALGRDAAQAVEEARERVARLIGAGRREIIFTSGATESNNLALKGTLSCAGRAVAGAGARFITAVTEHRSVLDTARHLERDGVRVTYLPVDRLGQVRPEQVAEALNDLGNRTALVSLMTGNNEIGTVHPVGEIGRLCRSRGVLFHTDAVQALGTVAMDVEEMGIDLLSLSAHKIYGPKGVGALYVRRRVRLEPLFDGGGHERGLRSGTLNVPAIVGLGRACELCRVEREAEAARLVELRERLCRRIQSQLDGVTVNGHPTERLAGNLNLSFAWVRAELVLANLRDVALSSGSACTSANPEPSHVLRALGIDDELAQGSLRFGLGRFTTVEEVDRVASEVVRVVKRLREQSPLYELHRAEVRG
jgi:cysteine desulfurase